MAKKIERALDLLRRWRWPGDRVSLGRVGEDIAARELERRGYEILERRWRCRLGEIDIVARHGDTLVVVEVKTRRQGSESAFGRPVDAVDWRKQRKLVQLARAYLSRARARGFSGLVRFDVVGVAVPEGRFARPDVQIVRSAFEA